MPLPACSTVSALCQLNIAITDTKHYLRQCICDLLSTVICPAYVPWSTFTTDARGLTCWSCSNVLIDRNGRARISDFGLSTILGEIGSTFATSSTGKPRGTLRWAAPELLDLVDHGDPKPQHTGPTIQSDIYSFGSLMLQVCGVTIFQHSRLVTTLPTLSRFCPARSRIITIPATCKSLLPFSRGRHLGVRIINM